MKTANVTEIIENVPLRTLSTLGVGGPARFYAEVHTEQELKDAFMWARENGQRCFVLGKGSNCLFDDQGFNGLVIHNKLDFLEEVDTGVFRAGAGYSFALLGVKSARKGWAGLEFASGIPASVGGAVFMNAGANGQETRQVLSEVDYLVPSGEIIRFKRRDLCFRYRWSMFQEMDGAIVAASFRLTPSDNAREKQLEIVNYRTATQPYGKRSAGCMFRNPDGSSAGALIDQLGLKGLRVGEAEVSELHANFLINRGEATSQDVLDLAAAIENEVFEQTGKKLEREVRFIAYEDR